MSLFYIRELNEYPVGGRRIFLLAVAVVATMIASYEAQIAPVLPLIMQEIHMDTQTYGYVIMATVVFSALGAVAFAPICDKYGRTSVLVPALFGTAICVFAMALVVHSVTSLFIVRAILAFIEGAVVAASAGLVRDFSPRMGRAAAYAFWTFGPVGSNFLAAFIAGATLAYFNDRWESQFYIAGVISIIVAFFVMFNVADLAPEVRHRIMHSEDSSVQDAHAGEKHGMMDAAKHWRVWWMTLGITFFLMLYFVVQQFGPLILVKEYGFKADEAASLSKYFWLLNLLTLVIAGVVSDRLQLRKVVSFVGTLLTIPVAVIWISLAGTHPSTTTMIILMSLLGGSFGIAYCPWMAWFSEALEDISTHIQASGWALWTFVTRAYVVCTVVPMTYVAQHYGWQPWMWLTVGGVTFYGVSVLLSHTPWLRREDPNVPTEAHVFVPETIPE